MLPCIACKKHVDDGDEEEDEEEEEEEEEEDEEEDGRIPRSAKAQVKSLSSQLKDVVLKVSAAYRQCRPCASSAHPRGGGGGNEQELTGTSSASSSADEWKIGKSGAMVKNKNSTGSSNSESKESSSKISASSSSQISTNSNSNGNHPTPTQQQQQEQHEQQQVDENGCQEWVAQVEPGVLITFIALPNGENELKRIRFSRDMFNKWQAESWWVENCERVHELYNVAGNDHSFPNSKREKGETSSSHKPDSHQQQQQDQHLQQDSQSFAEAASLAKSKHDTKPSASSSSSAAAAAVAGSIDELTEWVEEDEPGVYITVKLGPNGNRELKRVRFSREKFSERQAKLWWERNRFRIHDHYL